VEIFEALKLVGTVIQKIAESDQKTRIATAIHFKNLSETFSQFPAAYAASDRRTMQRLIGKTAGTAAALRGVPEFIKTLGESEAVRFLLVIEQILEAKELLESHPGSALTCATQDHLNQIDKASGYLEGYYQVLFAVSQATAIDS